MRTTHLTKHIFLSAIAIVLETFGAGTVAAKTLDLSVQADQPGTQISRYLYGQFAEHLGRGIYEGIWVGEDPDIPNANGYRDDVIAALKALQIPVVRWPGGCFADEYHWRDGIGPRIVVRDRARFS